MSEDGFRVLVPTPDFPPALGGIQTLLHEVVRRLDAVSPTVITFATDSSEAFDAASGIHTVRVRYDTGRHKASVARLNARTVALGLRLRPHAVLSGHVVMAPATVALQRTLRLPVVQYTHANEFESRPGVSGHAVRAAQATIAVSRYTAGLANAVGADPARIEVIPPGVAPPGFPLRPRDRRPTLLTIARLEEANKGHDVVLRALPRVVEQVPDVRWVVIGDGPLRSDLERQAAEAGVAEAVEFLGRVSDQERDAWLDRAHIFLLPSRPRESGGGGEGFGIVYLEAAAHALPVVGGAVGGALDAVDDGRTGLLVDPADPQAVGDALLTLLRDPQRARELGRAGAVRARRFTWESTAERVQELLRGQVVVR